MKSGRTITAFYFILLLVFLHLSGCSTSPTGGRGGVVQYLLTIDAEPDTVDTGTGMSVISCSLTSADTLMVGELVEFRAFSDSSSNSNITSASWISESSPSGTSPEVHYFPNDHAGDIDTIYALYDDAQGDTLAWDYTVVYINHP